VPARHDRVKDPRTCEELAVVRLGTAFFRRALDQVTDEGLTRASVLPGWDRRHLVAHVGYNARAVARLVDWAATGVETPMYFSPKARSEEIELGATLNPEALRRLNEHAAIDLDVRWRDLPAERWDARVVTAQGREVPASETVWMRTREVWLHAVDLDAGARIDDVPRPVLLRLVADVLRAWAAREEQPVRLEITDARADEERMLPDHTDAPTVSGSLPALAAWVTGRLPAERRSVVLTWSDGRSAPAPRWI
jgi:maleylpyruvate isomerase